MGQTPVTVPVERDGEYLVFVFAIKEGMGILGSTVQFRGQVMVTIETTPVLAATAISADTTSAGTLDSTRVNLAAAMIIFTFLLLAIIAFPFILVVHIKMKSRQKRTSAPERPVIAAS